MADNFTTDIKFFPFTNIHDKDFIALNYQINPYNHSYEPNTPCTVFNFSSFNNNNYFFAPISSKIKLSGVIKPGDSANS